MSLLDDVRIAATRYDNLRTRWVLGPHGEGAMLVCVGCGHPLNDHDPDCLFVLLPKIVAALEAAEWVARSVNYDRDEPYMRDYLERLKTLLWGEGTEA